MKKEQKGFASIVVILIILLILGGIWWAYKNDKPIIDTTNQATENTPPTTNTVSTNSTNSNGAVLTPTNTSSSPNEPAVITTSSNVFPGGTQYESPYGLTLAFPASWQAYAITKNTTSYGGVTPTDSTTFRLAEGPILTINVFTKEQWNRIKTQENAANQNVNTLGEGEYLGENSTYIYSYLIHAREAEARQVLANIIRF